MTVTTIREMAQHVGETVTIKGWLYNKRESGKLVFAIIRDGSGFMQCVGFKKELDETAWESLKSLTQESSVIITGTIRADDRAPYCGFEMGISQVEIVHLVTEEYPISLKEHGEDFLLSNRHLWLRTPIQSAIMRVRSEVIKACRDYFDDRGYTMIDAPIITAAACEGTTTLFELDYFDDKAYLSQSGQLYMEAAAMALGKVYCFGPAFRAEKSKTRRHLTEFWMIEPEIAFIDLEENMAIQEEMICHIVQRVLKNCQPELKTLERDQSKLEAITAPFPRLSYDDAIKLLQAEGSDIEWGSDFGAPDEAIICNKYDKPVFIHRFPTEIKAFYMKPDPERPEVALGSDLLAPEGRGEIIGGGQRNDNFEELLQKIEEHKLPREAFEWFLDLRKYGSVPHGGFGLGLERTVAWMCGIQHVRETSPFPRTIYRITP